jgi:hypothetical protein
MNQDVLEELQRRFGDLAKRMDEETMACSTAAISLDGGEYEVLAIIVKGPPESTLNRPVVRCQVLGIETSECPVMAVGVELPYQVETLTAWYWSWIPMHTPEQRSLLESMTTAPAWLLVVFSGEIVSRALIVRVSDIAMAQYRQFRLVVESYPTNPLADTRRAIEVAQVATSDALGDGFELEIVKDLGSAGNEPGE